MTLRLEDLPDSGSAIPVTISGDEAMSPPDKNTQPEPGTDDARSVDTEEKPPGSGRGEKQRGTHDRTEVAEATAQGCR